MTALFHRREMIMHREYPNYSEMQSSQWPNHREAILDALTAEPIEDGVTHPAEHSLERAWDDSAGATRTWLAEAIAGSSLPAGIRAALMRLVARTCPASAVPWGRLLAVRGLADADSDVREAAVRALESWGGLESRIVLQSHHDPLPWLATYVTQVLADLS